MTAPPEAGRLAGRAVFLSASVPSPDRAERYRRVPNAQVEIEQAVVAVARAVFAAGGRLVFGGHPSISPLVAMVAGEYGGLREPAVIHQLTVFRGEIPDATRQLEALGQARIVWHEPAANEVGRRWADDEPKWPTSLTRMRRSMLGLDEPRQLPHACVCVGGMEGVEEEARLFAESWREHGRPGEPPVYAFARTGGGALLLPRSAARAIDEEVLAALRERTPDLSLRYVPYPYIAQLIAREVADTEPFRDG